MKTNMQFGLSQINKPTPQWIKYSFRVIFLLLSFGVFMVSDYPGINEHTKLILLKWFAGVNMLCWGISKLFGIENKTNDDTTRDNNY